MVERLLIFFLLLGLAAQANESYDHFEILTASSPTAPRANDWKPGDGLAMEVGGMTWTRDGRLGVAIRKGEIWFIDGAESDSTEAITYHRFATGLFEPLGLLEDGDGFLVAQRNEVTRLRDSNRDGEADEYLTAATGWNVSGAYHGYVYGPERDGRGNLWITTNIDMGPNTDNDAPWRGWALTMNPDGSLTPQAAGMRSPSGLGTNLEGDMFYSDQQGTWMPATPISHLRRGAFYGNPTGIASQNLPESPLHLSVEPPEKVLYPEALKQLPELVPPAIWLPYNKVGRSATDSPTSK
jgi:glucose/arabinose dehydrogenase